MLQIYFNFVLSIAGEYLTGCQYIVGDSAYKLSTTVITPFRSNSSEGSQCDRNKFNRTLSKYRVRVENCLGLLKERFCSLKELKVPLRNATAKRFACQWIYVSCILHNLIIMHSEESDTIFQSFSLFENEGDNETAGENLIDNDTEGELKRKAILEIIK